MTVTTVGQFSFDSDTTVAGVRAYHAECLDAGCGWASRRFDREATAVRHARAHGRAHVEAAESSPRSSS